MCASSYLHYYRVLADNGRSSSHVGSGHPTGHFRLTVQWAGILAMRGIRMHHDIDELLDWGPNVAYYECALLAGCLRSDGG